ncbi:hypothetical protein J6590_017423 [Homalodisca vitripennis]|nr:hypothetical protein J6590_017423 [Homalodisca vitripennis]
MAGNFLVINLRPNNDIIAGATENNSLAQISVWYRFSRLSYLTYIKAIHIVLGDNLPVSRCIHRLLLLSLISSPMCKDKWDPPGLREMEVRGQAGHDSGSEWSTRRNARSRQGTEQLHSPRLSLSSDISIRELFHRRNYLSTSIVRAAIVIRVKWTSEGGTFKGVGVSVIDRPKVDRCYPAARHGGEDGSIMTSRRQPPDYAVGTLQRCLSDLRVAGSDPEAFARRVDRSPDRYSMSRVVPASVNTRRGVTFYLCNVSRFLSQCEANPRQSGRFIEPVPSVDTSGATQSDKVGPAISGCRRNDLPQATGTVRVWGHISMRLQHTSHNRVAVARPGCDGRGYKLTGTAGTAYSVQFVFRAVEVLTLITVAQTESRVCGPIVNVSQTASMTPTVLRKLINFV